MRLSLFCFPFKMLSRLSLSAHFIFSLESRGQLLNILFCVCLIINFFFDKYIDFFLDSALFNLPFNFLQVFFDV